jgi:hypothetical protein
MKKNSLIALSKLTKSFSGWNPPIEDIYFWIAWKIKSLPLLITSKS